MALNNLDKWWASLTTPEKERIASKIESKRLGVKTYVAYPIATRIWLEQTDADKQRIYRHCTDSHGILIEEYREANAMSY